MRRLELKIYTIIFITVVVWRHREGAYNNINTFSDKRTRKNGEIRCLSLAFIAACKKWSPFAARMKKNDKIPVQLHDRM